MKKLITFIFVTIFMIGSCFCQLDKSLTRDMELWDDFKKVKNVRASFKSELSITSLDTAFNDPGSVIVLDLSRQKLTELPENFVEFSNLEDLNLAVNSITNWEETFDLLSKLPKLRKLIIAGCGIDTLNENITKLKNLEVLDLSFNKMVSFP